MSGNKNNALNKLKFECFRCYVALTYEHVEKHAKERCEFVALNCPIKCGANFEEESDLREHLTKGCEKMKDRNVMILDFSSVNKTPDFFSGLKEKAKLMTKKA